MHPLQILVGALVPASLYALVGVGFVTVYRSSRVLNFAQGQMTLLGAYAFFSVSAWLSYEGLALLVTLAVAAAIGAVIYMAFIRPVTGQGPVIVVMLTIVIGTLIGGIFTLVWGSGVRYLHNPLSIKGIRLPDHAVTSVSDLTTIVVAVAVIGSFALVVRYTSLGVMMRASAENSALASSLGVNISRVVAVSWAFAMLTATLAGVAYGLRTSLDASLVTLGLTTFPAILIGGLDSVGGVLVGAFVLALLQGIVASAAGGQWTSPVSYLLLLAVLLVRPTGLFGSEPQERI